LQRAPRRRVLAAGGVEQLKKKCACSIGIRRLRVGARRGCYRNSPAGGRRPVRRGRDLPTGAGSDQRGNAQHERNPHAGQCTTGSKKR
jgi:hypothetical protein